MSTLDTFAKVRGFQPYWNKKPLSMDKIKAKTITYEVNNTAKVIEARRQQRLVEHIKKELVFPSLYVISSMPTDFYALRVAETLFKASMSHCLSKSLFNDKMPYWHVILGGFDDEVRNNPRAYANVPLLVLVNVIQESTNTKVEKLRDIIHLLPNTPKIIVTSGCNAMEFAMQIRTSPTAVLHLEPSKDIQL